MVAFLKKLTDVRIATPDLSKMDEQNHDPLLWWRKRLIVTNYMKYPIFIHYNSVSVTYKLFTNTRKHIQIKS